MFYTLNLAIRTFELMQGAGIVVLLNSADLGDLTFTFIILPPQYYLSYLRVLSVTQPCAFKEVVKSF